jgi:hypothetical protein
MGNGLDVCHQPSNEASTPRRAVASSSAAVPRVWEVELLRIDGERMGTDVDPRGDALEVISIGKGVLHSYNLRHEASAVQPGDRILSVNGEKVPQEMVRMLRQERRVVCKVAGVRPEGGHRRPRDGTSPGSASDSSDWAELCLASRADLCAVPVTIPPLRVPSRDRRNASPTSTAMDLSVDADAKGGWRIPPTVPGLPPTEQSTTAGSPPRSAQRLPSSGR